MFNIKCKVDKDDNYCLFQNEDGIRIFYENDRGEFVGSRKLYTEEEFGRILKQMMETDNGI